MSFDAEQRRLDLRIDFPKGSVFCCPGCGRSLIVRDWYEIGRYEVTDDGRCRTCATPLPGVFDGPVGDWGARRLPVRLRGD